MAVARPSGVRAARSAPQPDEVFAQIHDAGGIASLAHPGLVEHDEWIPRFAAAGLDALEVYHSRPRRGGDGALSGDGARRSVSRVSGGSDYHGDDRTAPPARAASSLPRDAFERLAARVR